MNQTLTPLVVLMSSITISTPKTLSCNKQIVTIRGQKDFKPNWQKQSPDMSLPYPDVVA